MSHQRYPSHDPVKEPHAISLKVLRLSRPSLAEQHPIPPPFSSTTSHAPPIPASLAYSSNGDTNPAPFILSPILNLPPSFGSAYVGETFSCTLCANHDAPPPPSDDDAAAPAPAAKQIRDVRVDAEMKTPGSATAVRLNLSDGSDDSTGNTGPKTDTAAAAAGVDLAPGGTLQKVVSFDLKEEGNHVLAVTVSYYEATATSGRTRTFRKLYQFICKASLIVRTKAGALPAASAGEEEEEEDGDEGDHNAQGGTRRRRRRRRWVLEAQLENCSEDAMLLERVVLEPEPGLGWEDCNWETSGSAKPVLHPGEVEQVCFLVEEQGQPADGGGKEGDGGEGGQRQQQEGRIVFGVLGIGWRTEMGNRGYLSTGKLGTRYVK